MMRRSVFALLLVLAIAVHGVADIPVLAHHRILVLGDSITQDGQWRIAPESERGMYFTKKLYAEEPLPAFQTSKNLLPSPILEGNPEWVEMYWKAWELAFHNVKKPAAGSPLVSNWQYTGYTQNIFQWDHIFIMMFARYEHQVFPAIESLDNFYCLQRPSGYICREFRVEDGLMIHYDYGDLFSPTGCSG